MGLCVVMSSVKNSVKNTSLWLFLIFDWACMYHVYSRPNRSLVLGVWILRAVPKRIAELVMNFRYKSLFNRPIFCDLRKTSDILGNSREKWNFVEHLRSYPANLANRALSKHAQNTFGNTTNPANRTSSKESIFGNPTNSTNKTSSVTFENLRESPSYSEKSSSPKEIRL